MVNCLARWDFLWAASCTADPPERSAPTEQPTPAPSPSDTCPLDAEVCEFSERLQEAVVTADFAALTAMSEAQSFSCSGPEPGGLGGPYPLCDGSTAGETRTASELRG